MQAYRAIIAVTMAAALVITCCLPALSLVVGAIHLISVAILCALPRLKEAPAE